MTKPEQRIFSTSDLYLSSFLSLSGIPPKLKINSGKVIFTFSASDDLYKLLMNFNSNISVPITCFVDILKELRGRMMDLRRGTK